MAQAASRVGQIARGVVQNSPKIAQAVNGVKRGMKAFEKMHPDLDMTTLPVEVGKKKKEEKTAAVPPSSTTMTTMIKKKKKTTTPAAAAVVQQRQQQQQRLVTEARRRAANLLNRRRDNIASFHQYHRQQQRSHQPSYSYKRIQPQAFGSGGGGV
jgi:hypothetical protein